MPNDIIVSVKGHILCTASREMANLIKSKVTNILFNLSLSGITSNHSHILSNIKKIVEECNVYELQEVFIRWSRVTEAQKPSKWPL